MNDATLEVKVGDMRDRLGNLLSVSYRVDVRGVETFWVFMLDRDGRRSASSLMLSREEYTRLAAIFQQGLAAGHSAEKSRAAAASQTNPQSVPRNSIAATEQKKKGWW